MAALIGPTPISSSGWGTVCCTSRSISLSRSLACLEHPDPTRGVTQREHDGAMLGRVRRPRPQPRASAAAAVVGEPVGGCVAQLMAQFRVGDHDERLEVVDRLHAGAHGGAARDQQHRDGFAVAARVGGRLVAETEMREPSDATSVSVTPMIEQHPDGLEVTDILAGPNQSLPDAIGGGGGRYELVLDGSAPGMYSAPEMVALERLARPADRVDRVSLDAAAMSGALGDSRPRRPTRRG
jgi:hypothetical protein